MYCRYIDSSLIGRRIDANYYEPEALREMDKLFNSGLEISPVSIICHRRNSGPFGSSLLASSYVPKGIDSVIFFRPVDCKDIIADIYNDNVYISKADNKRLSSSSFHAGSIILTKIGNSIGDVSVVPSCIDQCNISGNMMGMDTDNVDPYFLVAYLRCSIGHSQILRGIIGGPMPKIDMESIAEIQVPKPDIEQQIAIGNKIRTAERIRIQASQIWDLAKDELEGSIGVQLGFETFENFYREDLEEPKYHVVSTDPDAVWTFVENELGAQYYHPRRINARNIASVTGSWDKLSNLAKRVKKGKKQEDLISSRFLGLDSIDSTTGLINLSSNEGISQAVQGAIFQPNDILFSRLRPYLNKVTIWPNSWDNGFGSGELLVYRPNVNIINPYYLFFALKSYIGLYQIIDVTSGSTHPRVDAEVVDSIHIPRLGDEEEERIGGLVLGAFSKWFKAQQLVPAAISDIEAIIDGTLDTERLASESKKIERWLEVNPIIND